MARKSLSEMTTEELASKVRALKSIQTTIFAVFAVIIGTWLVLGLWRTNLPVFISTVVLAVGTSASQIAVRGGLMKELERRRTTTS
jgi:uncharacterized membrane protein